jgi:acetylornithine deacetylase
VTHCDVALLGVAGIDAEASVTEYSLEDTSVKRAASAPTARNSASSPRSCRMADVVVTEESGAPPPSRKSGRPEPMWSWYDRPGTRQGSPLMSSVPVPSEGASVERIRVAVDARRDRTTALLADLVRVRSVNPVFPGSVPAEEDRVQRLLADRLQAIGFDTDLWEPDPVALARYRGKPGYQENRSFGGRPNLAGRLKGSGEGRSIMLASHIDVVGVDPAEPWTVDPFGAEVKDGCLYGRGAADMKAGTASMFAAVETLLELGLRPSGDVIWGSVVDEETGGMGTLALVDRGWTADAAFMPEPTNGALVPMCRGILWGEITVRGRSSHIEIPQPDWRDGGAVDAIAKVRLILDAIDALNARWATDPAKTHPLLGAPNQVFVSMLRAGQHPSSWAEEATMTFDAQYIAAERDEHGLGGNVKRDIEEMLARAASEDEWLTQHPPELRWTVDADPGEVEVDHPFVQLVRRSARAVGLAAETDGVGFHTDSSLLIGAGIPTIVFGPGNPENAHRVDEHVSLEHVHQVTAALAVAIADWGAWR